VTCGAASESPRAARPTHAPLLHRYLSVSHSHRPPVRSLPLYSPPFRLHATTNTPPYPCLLLPSPLHIAVVKGTGTGATSAWAPPATRRSLSGPTGGVLSCREVPSGCPPSPPRGSLVPPAGLAVGYVALRAEAARHLLAGHNSAIRAQFGRARPARSARQSSGRMPAISGTRATARARPRKNWCPRPRSQPPYRWRAARLRAGRGRPVPASPAGAATASAV
jgi:hypothetical protein